MKEIRDVKEKRDRENMRNEEDVKQKIDGENMRNGEDVKEKRDRGNIGKLLQENVMYESCKLCPRQCGVNRNQGQRGYCGQTATLKIARAALHMWEEPCISGVMQEERGSGAVFFTGCQLGCVYCQNKSIAKGQQGTEITVERLAEIFLELQQKGAYNINLVTPSHYVPSIVPAIRQAKKQGLTLPIIYNTSSYENMETIRMLENDVRVYLPDFKYINGEQAQKYSYASDYPQVAKRAIEQMVKQAGPLQFDDETGCITQGVIVRHLVLPGLLEESKQAIRYLYETYGDNIYISIMNQYTPLPHVAEYPEINRKITEEEYDEVVDYAIEIGVEQGFIQEGETAAESFIPEFDGTGISPS